MIAGIITMGLGENTQVFNNPVFIGSVGLESADAIDLILEIENKELSLEIEIDTMVDVSVSNASENISLESDNKNISITI